MKTPTYQEFLGTLVSHLCRGAEPAALASMLLRTNSGQGRALLAHGTTGGRLDFDRLAELALSATEPHTRSSARVAADFNPDWLMQTARYTALRRNAPDPRLATALFELARATHGLEVFDQDAAALYAQLLVRLGRLSRLHHALRHLEIDECYRWSVELDALNPFTGDGDAVDAWLGQLNTIFGSGALEPVSLSPLSIEPFDRLISEASSYVDDDEMVTVVMPAYRPTASIFTAVSSILRQSWQNLELLIIDDGSPESYHGRLEDIAGMDDRIRIHTMPENRGTYVARNIGLNQARGEYITFQDFDDWAHPRRIEHQITVMRTDKKILATRTRAVRAFSDLTFTFVGYPPDRIYQPSLLFRRRPVLKLLGNFDTVRKSADMEFSNRLGAARPGSLVDMTESPPLTIYQLRHDSLSRDDAIPGWTHWSRLAYRDAYDLWHTQIRYAGASPYLDGRIETRPVPLPAGSWAPRHTGRQTTPHYDVVLINDWRRGGAQSQSQTIDEIRLMLDQGMRVAVAHMETPYPLPSPQRPERLSSAVQELISARAVDLIHVTQDAYAELVIVCDPATLQFLPDVAPSLKTDRVAILARLPERDFDFRYRVIDCSANAERLFSRRAVWVPRDARTRQFLAEQLEDSMLAEFDLPIALDPSRWAAPTRRPGSGRPILGRNIFDHWRHWPADQDELLFAYPDDDRFDVRIMGGHHTPVRVLGRQAIPPNWVSFAEYQLSAREFLAQLDFFVYFHHPQAATRMSTAALEAAASGCVVILPRSLEPTHDDGAVYCEPQTAQDVILHLHGSPADFEGQQERARAYLEKAYIPTAFQDRLARLFKG